MCTVASWQDLCLMGRVGPKVTWVFTSVHLTYVLRSLSGLLFLEIRGPSLFTKSVSWPLFKVFPKKKLTQNFLRTIQSVSIHCPSRKFIILRELVFTLLWPSPTTVYSSLKPIPYTPPSSLSVLNPDLSEGVCSDISRNCRGTKVRSK